jgi:autotransporter-associated beta strand protein
MLMNTRRLRIFLPLVALALALLVGGMASQSSAQVVQSTWNGVNGDWGVATNWTPSAAAPNNTGGISYAATINAGTAFLDGPVTLSHLTLTGGAISLGGDTRPTPRPAYPLLTDAMLMTGGLVGGLGKLRIEGDLDIRGGVINNSSTDADGFFVGGDIYKRGYGAASLAPFRGNDYAIIIERGKLGFSNSGLGTHAVGVTVVSPEFARLQGTQTGSINEDVYLNNGHGFARTGSLLSRYAGVNMGTGNLYLGEVGATVGTLPGAGVSDESLGLGGKIHGGDLTIVGRGSVSISGTESTYSGVTRVGMNGDFTDLGLFDNGELHTTSAIHVGGNARLRFNQDRSGRDRIGNAIPIILYGGGVEISAGPDPATPEVLAESLGVLSLSHGANAVNLITGPGAVNFARLDRQGLSTIDFGLPGALPEPGPSSRIGFDEAPVLTNSIIGGWANVGMFDFATYDPAVGVTALANKVARPTQVENAAPGSHVLNGFGAPLATLTKDTTVATLAIKTEGVNNLNLGGHTLTLTQGGLLRGADSSPSTIIENGRLTAGDGADPAVLYLHAEWRFLSTREGMTIRADIVDNLAGGPVSLVTSGNVPLMLTGSNSYTGATVVQENTLTFASPTAFPQGRELIADAGTAFFQFDTPGIQRFSRIVLRQNGSLTTQIPSGGATRISPIAADADEYLLESGSLAMSLVGDGPMRKVGDGVVELECDSPNYTGAVTIERGVLHVAGISVRRTPQALGTGGVTILPGGTLIHASIGPAGATKLLNSKVNLAGGDVGVAISSAQAPWNFEGAWRVTAPSRLLLFDPQGRDEIAPAVVNVHDAVTLENNSALSVLGSGVANFTTGIVAAGDATLSVDEGAATFGSITAAPAGGALRLRGPGAFTLPNQLGPGSPGPITLDIGAGSTAKVVGNTQLTVDNDATLIVNGTLANAEPLIIKNGTLAGSGVVGNVNNQSGEVSPGNSIGVLTTGSFNQGPGGLLTMELLAGPPNTSDLVRATSATLAGTLHAVLAPAGNKSVGTTFNLVIANTISISSLQLTTSGLGNFQPWLFVAPIVGGSDVGKQVLQLMLVPEPAGATLALMTTTAIAAVLRRRRSAAPRS